LFNTPTSAQLFYKAQSVIQINDQLKTQRQDTRPAATTHYSTAGHVLPLQLIIIHSPL